MEVIRTDVLTVKNKRTEELVEHTAADLTFPEEAKEHFLE
jgi:hypothetical protein